MTETPYRATEEFALEMDARDPLASYRERFFLPRGAEGSEWIYLCGHSLGLQPKAAREYIEQELEDWARLGVEGHFHARRPWMPYHELLTEQTAALLGARADEVVVMNSLTVNLHLMMVSFYRPTKQRHKILVERGAFPSDQYAVASQIRFHGFDPATSLIELTPRDGGFCLRDEDIDSVIEREGDSIALILPGAVNYATGQALICRGSRSLDMSEDAWLDSIWRTRRGICRCGCTNGPDFAVWCSYKYLNGGPGCPVDVLYMSGMLGRSSAV